MKKLLTTALLASASFALTSMDAKAVGIGDLILGFRVTDNTGTGATSNLEVDFGNMSQFTSLAPGTTLTLSTPTTGTGLSLADLTSTYGANWNTRPDLAWGLIAATGRTGTSGVSGFPLDEVWASSGELPSGTPGQVLLAKRAQSQAAASAAYENMVVVNPGDPSGLAQTGLGTNATMVPPTPLDSSNSEVVTIGTATDLNGSWTSSEFNTAANTEFNYFPGTPLDAFTYGGDGVNLTSTPTTSIVDFYQLNPNSSLLGTPGTLIGKFSLSQTGVLTYQTVPEPSSIGLMGVGFLSLFGMVVLRRRRSVVA